MVKEGILPPGGEGKPGEESFHMHGRNDQFVPRTGGRKIIDRDGVRADIERFGKVTQDAKLRFHLALRGLFGKTLDDVKKLPEEMTKSGNKFIAGPVAETDSIMNGETTATAGEVAALYTVVVGAMLDASEARKTRNKKLTGDKDPDGFIKAYLDLLDYGYVGQADLKIGKISLEDIARQDKHKQLDVTDILYYSMEALLMHHRTHAKDYIADNNTFPAKDFPEFTASKLQDATFSLINMFNVLGNESFPELNSLSRKYPEYVGQAKGLLKKMKEFHGRFYDVLFDPTAPEFSKVKTMVERYVSIDKGIQFLAIHFLSQSTFDKIQSFYRKARKLQGHSEQGEFYRQLADAIEEYTEAVQPVSQIALFDDVESVFLSQHEDIPHEIDFSTLQKTVANIFSQGKRTHYEIDPMLVDWGDIVQPQSAEVKFSSSHPSKFAVTLSYEGEEEQMDVELAIDSKQGTFNWNFLDSPDDPKMVPFYSALVGVTGSLLEQIYIRAKAKRDEKQQARARVVETHTSRIRGERPESEEEPVSKKRRKQSVDFSLDSLFADPESPDRVKKKITVPKNLDELIPRGLHPDEEAAIRERIKVFNETGGMTGAMKKLTDVDAFSLKIGRFRVILKGKPTDRAGEQGFTIVRIDRRRNDYRGWQDL